MNFLNRLLPFFAICVSLYGCGDASKSSTVPFSSAQKSAECISCHGSNTSTVTGAKIADEWRASVHNTKDGAACGSCHEKGRYPHPDGVVSYSKYSTITVKPDDTICTTCHTAATMQTYDNHFSATAVYASGTDTAKCRRCHNPHDTSTLLTYNKDWAASGHGDVKGVAWSRADFKYVTCAIRCHTATGYVNYSSFTEPTASWATASDATREVLSCRACHTSYDFKNSVRSVKAYTAPYKRNHRTTNIAFFTAGDSNICIPCHAGRSSGQDVRNVANYAAASLPDPHFLPAAGIFYGVAGYHYYSSISKYDTGYNTGTNYGTWSHGRMGMINPSTGQKYVAVQGTASASTITDSGTNGPCIACHFGNQGAANVKSHTLSAVTAALSTAPNGGCYGCHGATSTPEDIPELIEEEKALYDRGMDFFRYELARKNMFFNEGFRQFVTTAGGTSPIMDWTVVGPTSGDGVSGANTMGAAFNYYLLNEEKGAHVHNRAYARRLMSHSIRYLQTGKNIDVVSNRPATSTNPNTILIFSNYSSAHPAALSTGAATPVSIYQLKGWILTGAPNYRLR